MRVIPIGKEGRERRTTAIALLLPHCAAVFPTTISVLHPENAANALTSRLLADALQPNTPEGAESVNASPTERIDQLMNRPRADLSSEERILEAANSVYNETGAFPVPLSLVAERAEVSRSLIYSHFPDQLTLLNRLIDQHVALLAPDVTRTLIREKRFSQACFALSELLFHHFVNHGRLIFQAPQDEFMRQAPNKELAQLLRKTLVRLTRLAAIQFDLKTRDALFIMLIISAIPEEAARLVSTRQISLETGKETLRRTLKLTLRTLKKEAG